MADIYFLPESRTFLAHIPFQDNVDSSLFIDYGKVNKAADAFEVYFTVDQGPSLETLLRDHGYHLRMGFKGSYQEIYQNPSAPQIPAPTVSAEPPPTVDVYEVAKETLARGVSQCITGEGGSGKSYLAWQLFAAAKRAGKKVAMTAMTGTACVALRGNLPDALLATLGEDPVVTTCHSFFGLAKKSNAEVVAEDKDPVEFHLRNILHSPTALDHWLTTDVVVVDEVSMMTKEMFDLLQHLNEKRELRPNAPIQFVLVGDFYQLPPVEKGVSAPRFCFESCYWDHVIGNHVVVLNKNFRIVAEQQHWRQLLQRLRMGHSTVLDREELQGMSSIIREITPDHLHLYGRRFQVDAENQRRNGLLRAAGAPGRVYTAVVTKMLLNTVSGGDRNITPEFRQFDLACKLVNTMCRDEDQQDMAHLELFVGSRVMVDTNNHALGLVNGMRGTVTALQPDRVDVLFDGMGSRTVPLQTFTESHTGPRVGSVRGDVFTCTLKRLPMRLAFAMTIHKAQATTLEKVYIKFTIDEGTTRNGTTGVFEKGQVYVALSRCRDSRNLIVDGVDTVWGKLLEPLPQVVAFYMRHTPATTAAQCTNPEPVEWFTRTSPVPIYRPPCMIMYLRQKVAADLDRTVVQQKLDRDEREQRRVLQTMFQDQMTDHQSPTRPNTDPSTQQSIQQAREALERVQQQKADRAEQRRRVRQNQNDDHQGNVS